MKSNYLLACLVLSFLVSQVSAQSTTTLDTNEQVSAESPSANDSPLKVLLIAGGCCHDYAAQTKILKEGIEKKINATVTVVYNADTTTKATFDIYASDDWADEYDVILHDECCADVTDSAYVDRILDRPQKWNAGCQSALHDAQLPLGRFQNTRRAHC